MVFQTNPRLLSSYMGVVLKCIPGIKGFTLRNYRCYSKAFPFLSSSVNDKSNVSPWTTVLIFQFSCNHFLSHLYFIAAVKKSNKWSFKRGHRSVFFNKTWCCVLTSLWFSVVSAVILWLAFRPTSPNPTQNLHKKVLCHF